MQLAEGKPFEATKNVSAEAARRVTYDAATKILLLGRPLAITKDNVGPVQLLIDVAAPAGPARRDLSAAAGPGAPVHVDRTAVCRDADRSRSQ